jgi:hypothetical protein
MIPKRHLPMAVESFQSRFPGTNDVAQLDQRDFREWIEDLPIANV